MPITRAIGLIADGPPRNFYAALAHSPPEATWEAGANVSKSQNLTLGWQLVRISRKETGQVNRNSTCSMLSDTEAAYTHTHILTAYTTVSRMARVDDSMVANVKVSDPAIWF